MIQKEGRRTGVKVDGRGGKCLPGDGDLCAVLSIFPQFCPQDFLQLTAFGVGTSSIFELLLQQLRAHKAIFMSV